LPCASGPGARQRADPIGPAIFVVCLWGLAHGKDRPTCQPPAVGRHPLACGPTSLCRALHGAGARQRSAHLPATSRGSTPTSMWAHQPLPCVALGWRMAKIGPPASHQPWVDAHWPVGPPAFAVRRMELAHGKERPTCKPPVVGRRPLSCGPTSLCRAPLGDGAR
jgi:hypothetical protein